MDRANPLTLDSVMFSGLIRQLATLKKNVENYLIDSIVDSTFLPTPNSSNEFYFQLLEEIQ